jgi:hypothetical protein
VANQSAFAGDLQMQFTDIRRCYNNIRHNFEPPSSFVGKIANSAPNLFRYRTRNPM